MSETLSPERAIDTMKRNKPTMPSTFGPCCRGCGRSARGCGMCFDCARDELAKCVGDEQADAMSRAIIESRLVYKEVMEVWEARQNDKERTATDG